MGIVTVTPDRTLLGTVDAIIYYLHIFATLFSDGGAANAGANSKAKF